MATKSRTKINSGFMFLEEKKIKLSYFKVVNGRARQRAGAVKLSSKPP